MHCLKPCSPYSNLGLKFSLFHGAQLPPTERSETWQLRPRQQVTARNLVQAPGWHQLHLLTHSTWKVMPGAQFYIFKSKRCHVFRVHVFRRQRQAGLDVKKREREPKAPFMRQTLDSDLRGGFFFLQSNPKVWLYGGDTFMFLNLSLIRDTLKA